MVAASSPRAVSRASLRPVWLVYLGAGYVLLALLVTLNVPLVGWGPPAPGISGWLSQPGELPGAPGLRLLAWTGAGVILLTAWRGRLSTRQWQIAAAIAVWTGSVAMSMVLLGTMRDGRFWSVAVSSTAVAVAGSLLTRQVLVRLLLALGWFFGWGSVLAGLSDLVFDWPSVLVGGQPRYERWLSMLGLHVGDFATLNGVTPGRVYVGLTCAILLVYAVRAAPGRTTWLMSAGLVLATMWSFSRTGMVAMVAGLLVTLIPFERIRAFGWTLAGLLTFILLPLSLSAWLRTTSISDGTTVWRFDLWQDYLHNPRTWAPLGIGPKPSSLDYADHAHQQLLEALAAGGWLGLAGCLAFITLATWVAVKAAGIDNRAAVGVLFVMGAIFQVDVVTYSATYTVLNNALVLLAVVFGATAGMLTPSPTTASALPRRTP